MDDRYKILENISPNFVVRYKVIDDVVDVRNLGNCAISGQTQRHDRQHLDVRNLGNCAISGEDDESVFPQPPATVPPFEFEIPQNFDGDIEQEVGKQFMERFRMRMH